MLLGDARGLTASGRGVFFVPEWNKSELLTRDVAWRRDLFTLVLSADDEASLEVFQMLLHIPIVRSGLRGVPMGC